LMYANCWRHSLCLISARALVQSTLNKTQRTELHQVCDCVLAVWLSIFVLAECLNLPQLVRKYWPFVITDMVDVSDKNTT
jgi:hypothetical protein